ncbi:cupin domain-containing protein [Salinigranum salinum]|uniref:cupin domain-containing protein n=1 Tax=Salinigranum salinum TaxID=1364937 RepID=UPI00195D297E|nr:cupin domain-containing protein [Salinigranum salinum]
MDTDTDDADHRPSSLVRRAEEVEYEEVSAAEGLRKGVLVSDADGAPHFAIRRFTLAPGAEVPRHTNEVEHEQYVLAGEYVVGLGDEEVTVAAGDALLIPAGTVHWYRNESDEEGAFLCAVPNGDDAIELVDGSDD